MSLPVSVVVPEKDGQELPVRMRDVSYRGLYFFGMDKFEAGGEIDFVITLPPSVSKTNQVRIRCHGEIVRVESAGSGNENMGVAARIERYEFVSTAAAA
ncbi:MAG: PilZ domain-containing protein [Acidobacteriota bacterium]|nr:PilZ domain-containing protein [Acidobacteriota bacterium]